MAVGFAVVAIACCAGLPLLLALGASVGIGAVVGIAGGVVAAALLLGAVVSWAVRRRPLRERPARHPRYPGAAYARRHGRKVTR